MYVNLLAFNHNFLCFTQGSLVYERACMRACMYLSRELQPLHILSIVSRIFRCSRGFLKIVKIICGVYSKGY